MKKKVFKENWNLIKVKKFIFDIIQDGKTKSQNTFKAQKERYNYMIKIKKINSNIENKRKRN